jgi:plasmid stabilization system protein ParE
LCGKLVVYYEVVASLDEVHILTVRHGREQEPELEGLKGE